MKNLKNWNPAKLFAVPYAALRSLKNGSKRRKILALGCAALLTVTVAVTVAIFTDITKPIKNKFSLPVIKNQIVEEFDKTEKESVKVKNIGDSDEYLRVAVVVNWKDEDGNVSAKAPVLGTDYTVSYNQTDWLKIGDYWYYKTALSPKATTNNLLATSAKVLDTATPPEGYTLSVEIVEEAIQADPPRAIQEAWGVSADDGKIVFN